MSPAIGSLILFNGFVRSIFQEQAQIAIQLAPHRCCSESSPLLREKELFIFREVYKNMCTQVFTSHSTALGG
jgi:hypothetical protein